MRATLAGALNLIGIALLLASCTKDDDDTGTTPTVQAGQVVGISTGGGEISGGGYTARISVGDPITAQTLSNSDYQLTVGIGAVQRQGGAP